MNEQDKNQNDKNKWLKNIGIAFLVLIILYAVGIFNWEKKPGSFFEKPNYTGKFYVHVYPGKDTTKNYKLPGDIEKTTECVGGPNDEQECDSNYYLYTIYWPNGGNTDFSNCTITDKKTHVYRMIAKSTI